MNFRSERNSILQQSNSSENQRGGTGGRHAVTRREFITIAGGTAISAGCGHFVPANEPSLKAPFRVLYSNDTTNILSCTSPWHKHGEAFRPEMLEATVDEVAGTGVDAHLLQPGLGWVPWWPSKVYPPAEHYRWLKETYGVGPDGFARYVLDGGDLVQLFIDRCRKRGQAPFISFRLNDGHHKEWVNSTRGEKISSGAGQGLCKFYVDHPEYRIGSDLKDWAQRVQNWAIPEVRAYRFSLIRELCENYDFDGFELDFLRMFSFFQLDKTTAAQRCGIMTGFVRDVRALLDRTARGGKHRWLCARIPCYAAALDPLGIDPRAMADAGLDMLNVSSNYFTVQQTDFAAIRRMAPNASAYLELCHTTWNGKTPRPGYDQFPFRRATPEQMQTAAHLVYSRGGNGMSAFNFVYYRESGGPERGPFNEPPFHVFKHLGDPAWLARQPQHWFIASGWKCPYVKEQILPRNLASHQTAEFAIDLAPPAGGWTRGGRLRIQTELPVVRGEFRTRLNGTELKATADVSEPYPDPYPPMLGQGDDQRAWLVPASLLRDGINRIEIASDCEKTVRLAFIDLAVR